MLIDESDDGMYIGRTERDAPEVDNNVIVHSQKPLVVGSFIPVNIVDAREYDLVGNALL